MKHIFYILLLFIPLLSFSQFDYLKAVLIVGDQQDGTINAIEDMEEIHSFFKSKNVVYLQQL